MTHRNLVAARFAPLLVGAADTEAADHLLIRHGQSEWNRDGRWQGQANPPLTELGAQQAAAVVACLPPVVRIVSSDLERAHRTAEIIHKLVDKSQSLPQLELHKDLRERDAGPWSGLTKAEIELSWPGMLKAGERPPGFETDDHFRQRILSALSDVLLDQPPTLVVAHGGLISNLEAWSNRRGRGTLDNLGGVYLSSHLTLEAEKAQVKRPRIAVGRRFRCGAVPSTHAAIT